jgi:glycosyltransferase involved in cell wall biosynthesis
MRILHFTDCFFPEMSGISDSIRTTASALETRGHQVAFVAPRYSRRNYAPLGDRLSAFPDESVQSVLRLPSFQIPLSPTGQSRTALPIGASLSFVRRFRPDVLHAHTPWGAGWEAVMAGRRLGLPVIGTNHTMIEEFSRYSGPLAQPLAPALRRYASMFYNRVAFLSAPCRKLIEDMRADGFRGAAEAVPNPVALDRFRPAEPERREAMKRKHGIAGPMLLYAGRLSPEKNIDQIIEAQALLTQRRPDLQVVLTGYGACADRLRSLAHTLGVAERVKFVGFVDDQVLVELYAAADLFAIMSTAETQSIALMQAMSAGLPVIAARAGALPEYVDETTGRLVEPGDVATLAEEVEGLLADPARQGRFGKGGAAFVTRFSAQAVAARWENLYQGVLIPRAAA